MAGAPSESDRLLVVALYGLAAAIFSAGIASLYALMTHAYPPSCRSAGIGFGIFVARVGAIAGSGLGGTLVDMGGGRLLPFFGTLVGVSARASIAERNVQVAIRPEGQIAAVVIREGLLLLQKDHP